jgi:hypothetical protein
MAISPNRQTTFVPNGSPVGVTDQSTIRLNDSGFIYASDHHNDRLLVFELGTRSVTGSVSGKLDFPAHIVTGKQEDWYQAPSRHGSQPRRAGMTEATLRHPPDRLLWSCHLASDRMPILPALSHCAMVGVRVNQG